jgi:CHAD domain-containing protein
MNATTNRHVHLGSAESVTETVREILLHNLDHLKQWEPAAYSWDDIEGVHQMRVTFRRMRSALKVFRKAIPTAIAQRWADELGELGGVLGAARDMDVFIVETLGDIGDALPTPGAEGLYERAEHQRAAAYDRVRTMLDGERYQRFKAQFTQWASLREWEQAPLQPRHRKLLLGSVVPFARKVLDIQERRALEAGANVDKTSSADMHRLRIECKKLRYAAEFFRSLFGDMDDYIGHMKGLQDLLGMMNDVTATHAILAAVLNGEQDGDLKYCGGFVAGWRSCQYRRLLVGFDEHWEKFVEVRHPWWKKLAGSSENRA